MNDIDRWFERAARRENRTASLYSCLLTGRIFAYFRYRLRFALLLDATQFVIHVAEFLIILTALGGLAAFTVMILRVGSLVVSGAWWGLLEVMRERLRGFTQSGDRDGVEREIGRWLMLSLITAATLAIAGALLLTFVLPPDHDPIGRFYAFLVIVELAVRLPVRVLHSGVYATRRVYRPLWTLFAPTAVQLFVIGAGMFVYPTGAIVVALITSNAVGIWITLHYTREVYRLSGLRPTLHARGRERLPSIPPRLGAETALAGIGLRLDAVAVLAIAGIYGTNTRSFDLTAGYSAWRDIDAFQFFYLVLPLFRGGYEATGLFYFDFVRLRRIPAFRQFRVTFFHKLLYTTPVVALYFWALTVALGLFVLPDVPFSFLLALLPLFVTRSVIGTYQMRLFAEGRFRTLIATIVFTAGLFALVWIDVNPASDLLQITAAMLVLLIVHINIQHRQDRSTSLPTLLSWNDWLRALKREPGPVRVGTATVPDWIPLRQRAAAIRLTRQLLHSRGHFALRSPTALVFYERATDASTTPPHLALQSLTGGAVNRGRHTASPPPDGRQALEEMLARRWVPPVDVAARHDHLDNLRTEFRDIFPDGVVLDLATGEGIRAMRALDPGVLAAMLPAAMRSLEDGLVVVRVARQQVSPVFSDGRMRLLCVLPASVDGPQFQRWVRAVKAWQTGSPAAEGRAHARIG